MSLADDALKTRFNEIKSTAVDVVKRTIDFDLDPESVNKDGFFWIEGMLFKIHNGSILVAYAYCKNCKKISNDMWAGNNQYTVNSKRTLGDLVYNKSLERLVGHTCPKPQVEKIKKTPWWRTLPIPHFTNNAEE